MGFNLEDFTIAIHYNSELECYEAAIQSSVVVVTSPDLENLFRELLKHISKAVPHDDDLLKNSD